METTRKTQDLDKVGRTFLLVGAIGILIQVIIYAVSRNGLMLVSTGSPFLTFLILGVAFVLHARRQRARA